MPFPFISFVACRAFRAGPSNEVQFQLSNKGHTWAGNSLGIYDGEPFVAGGVDSYDGETETLNLKSGEWRIEQNYPFHKYIAYSAVVSMENEVILFGGYEYSGSFKTVASFSNRVYSKIGMLKQGRYGHNGIISDSKVILVGGTYAR